jgi:hypothetical protein
VSIRSLFELLYPRVDVLYISSELLPTVPEIKDKKGDETEVGEISQEGKQEK